MDIFISYARSTEPQAHLTAQALRNAGYRVWRDDELPAHRAYADVIEERVQTAKAVVVIWSTDAVKSEWVRSEANRAREQRKVVQMAVDSALPPMPFDQIQCVNLTGWMGDENDSGWKKVLASVADLVGTPGGETAAGVPSLKAILIADIEGASVHWLNHRAIMAEAADDYRATIRRASAARRGEIFRTTGDLVFAAFAAPGDAIETATAVQEEFAAKDWPDIGPLKLKIAVDYAPAARREGEFAGRAVTRASKLLPLGHGGQVLMTAAVIESGVTGIFLGAHPLDDPLLSVGIYQSAGPAFPALLLPDARITNLPRRLASLIGRDKEIGSTTELLSRTALVSIVGPGGVGKTRVAIEAGLRALPDLEDGVWLVELATVADPDLVAAAVARAMNIELPSGQDPVFALVERLRGRRCLILLDSCEHVIDAIARLAEAVLDRAPGIKLLATSQESLGVEGERTFRIPTLSEADAVVLFVERAKAADANFSVSPRNEDAVAAICTRLDGVPLAIEMAAARAPSLGCEGVLQRLDDRFRVLTGGRRTAMPRHRTLMATLDWSYDLLSDTDAAVFRRLGVFSAGFTLEAAANVASDRAIDSFGVIDALSNLVAKSLVVADTDNNRTRYRLLQTTHAYALEKLAKSGDTTTTRTRHAEWYADFTKPLWAQFVGQASDDDLAARYNIELPNIEAALDWGFSAEGDSETGLSLIARAQTLWDAPSLVPRIETAVPFLGPQTPALIRALLFSGRAHGWMMLKPARALEVVDEAIDTMRPIGDPVFLCNALGSKGFALWFTGQFEAAQAVSDEAQAIAATIPPSRILARSRGLAASLLLREGKPKEAQALLYANADELRSFGADGLANFWQSIGMRFAPSEDEDADIEEWRALLARIKPTDVSGAATAASVGNELAFRLARRGRPGDFDEARRATRSLMKVSATSLLYRYFLPMAVVAIKSDRAADAARIMGYADARRRAAGEVTLSQGEFDEVWALLSEALPESERTALIAQGARLDLDDAMRIALGDDDAN